MYNSSKVITDILNARHGKQIVLISSVAIFTYLYIVHCWICDDILLTYRSIIHFVNGDGIVWNPGERLQIFTHPVWFFLLSLLYLSTKSFYYGTIIISGLLSGYSFWKILREADSYFLLFVSLSLLFSRAFNDYTSSGLENPLSYALFAVFLFKHFNESYDIKYYFIAGLIFLTRMDFAVVLLPASIYAFYKTNYKIKIILPSLIMILAWFGFSTFYFGFPFPNSFLAKMNTNYGYFDFYLKHFIEYALFTIKNDPWTLVQILIGISFIIVKEKKYSVISAGILLYMVYVSTIGGCFMAGRFFTVPFYISVFLTVVCLKQYPVKMYGMIWAALFFSSIIFNFSSLPIFNDSSYFYRKNTHGVGDERGLYFQRYGLIAKNRHWPEIGTDNEGEIMLQGGGAGLKGIRYFKSYILDYYALGSPYLPYFPVYQENQAVGHIYRKNALVMIDYLMDKKDAEYCMGTDLYRFLENVNLVATGDLFSLQRFQAIIEMNFSSVSPEDFVKTSEEPPDPLCLVKMKYDRNVSVKKIPIPQLNYVSNEKAYLNKYNSIEFRRKLVIHGFSGSRADRILILLENEVGYYVVVHSTKSEIHYLPPIDKPGIGFREVKRNMKNPFDYISIIPKPGKENYYVGMIRY